MNLSAVQKSQNPVLTFDSWTCSGSRKDFDRGNIKILAFNRKVWLQITLQIFCILLIVGIFVLL